MNLLRLFATGLLLAPLLATPAAAQVLDPTFSPPTGLYAPGAVYSLGSQQADGKTVVAGFFTRVNGSAASAVIRLDAAGALDLPFSQNIGQASNVYRVKNLPNGQYLLGANGGSVTAGNISRPELLRLNANGTADASFDTGGGPTSTGSGYGYAQDYAVQPDGKVVVVGSFDGFNGASTPGVVRLNANGSVDTGFSVGTGFNTNPPDYSTGNAVAIQADGKILVGGDFTSFNGQPAKGLVRLNANGSLDNTFLLPASYDLYVEGLVLQPDGKILVNGNINTGTNSSGLARLLPSGSIDTGFSAPVFASVSTGNYSPAVQLQPDGKILAVGYFSAPGANYVVRLNGNGSQDFSFAETAGPNSLPASLALQANGSVLIGGAFSSFNGRETPLGRLTSTGAPDATYAPTLQIPGRVSALVRQPDGKVLIGGNFSELNGQPVHRLVRLTSTGALDASFAPSGGLLLTAVNCLALQPDGKVLAGNIGQLLRFLPSGAQDPTFTVPFRLTPVSLAVQADGKVVVAGQIRQYFGSVYYESAIRLTSTGAHDPSFVVSTASSTGVGSSVYMEAVALQPDGRVLVGGIFRFGQQSYVGRVVRYETTGALDPTFTSPIFTAVNGTSGLSNHISSLVLQPDGKILAGGNFGAVSGTLHYGVARLQPNGTVDPAFSPNSLLTGTVYSVALQPNGRVLLGGAFTNAGTNGTLSNLARVLDNGQTDVSFTGSATPSGAVRALAVQPDGTILLAGSFTSVGGQPARGVARITAPNVLSVAAPSAVAARTAAWPVPAHGQLHVALDASAHPLSVELLDALGRQVSYQAMGSSAELTLSVASLPAGMYVLRATYAAGTVTRRVAVE